MRKTRVGADRVKAQELRATVAAAKAALKAHTLTCYRCTQAGQDVYAKCSLWWAIRRNQHTTQRFLDAYEQPATGGTLTLFEVDDQ